MTADCVCPCSSVGGKRVSKGLAECGEAERTEGGFDNTDLGGGRVDTGECTPIVDNETGTDHVRTSVYCTSLRKDASN
jgi:hypothetical protein